MTETHENGKYNANQIIITTNDLLETIGAMNPPAVRSLWSFSELENLRIHICHIHICAYINLYIHTYIRVHLCICICLQLYMYTHIHRIICI
jgi:hypothetical protein